MQFFHTRRGSFPAICTAAALTAALAGPSPSAQTVTPSPGPDADEFPSENHLFAWVDPEHGTDSAQPFAQIGSQANPFKTLNYAIESAQAYMVANYAPEFESTQATVYALPGVYGPIGGVNGPNSSGDVLPIVLRDRVHVKGAGAGRTILRGNGTPTSTNLFWPTGSEGTLIDPEVLVDLSATNQGNIVPGSNPQGPPPWFDPNNPDDEVFESFSGFTLQGGDVQVLAKSGAILFAHEPRAIVSNCVFDMRDGWAPDPASSNLVSGPWFGVMMIKAFASISGASGLEEGYIDQKLLIANNSFILAQYQGSGWVNEARSGAVGLIDVTDPTCTLIPRDCDEALRGVGNSGIVNNLFRTRPGSNHFAMMGIDDADTLVDAAGVSLQTNAFAASRVGSANGVFTSQVVGNTAISSPADVSFGKPDYWDCGGAALGTPLFCGAACTSNHTCTAGTLPAPAVAIFDGGTTGADPAFVGEYLASSITGLGGAVDWRLLPGRPNRPNPLQDMGYSTPAGTGVQMVNGSVFPISDRPGANPFEWDGEGYGNPRIVGTVDIGADEIHLMSMAGSWGNDSSSHGTPGYLRSDALPGGSERYLVMPIKTQGVALTGKYVRVNGDLVNAPSSGVPTAWTVPPGVLTPPTVNSSLPADFQTKYVSSASGGGNPAPWIFTLSAADQVLGYQPLAALPSQTMDFIVHSISDDECASGCRHGYFSTQAIVKTAAGGSPLLRGNMQAEYR